MHRLHRAERQVSDFHYICGFAYAQGPLASACTAILMHNGRWQAHVRQLHYTHYAEWALWPSAGRLASHCDMIVRHHNERCAS